MPLAYLTESHTGTGEITSATRIHVHVRHYKHICILENRKCTTSTTQDTDI